MNGGYFYPMRRLIVQSFIFGLSTIFAGICRAMNGGFGLMLFFPIYAISTLFHIVALYIVLTKNRFEHPLNATIIISHLFFLGFLLFSMDAGDSTGGLTILVALEYFGIGTGLKSPSFFYGKSGFIIHLIQLILFLTLDIKSLRALKRKTLSR